MKKILMYVLIVGFIISCGGEVGSSGGNKDKSGNNSSSKGDSKGDSNGVDEDPCDKPSAQDGETPPALPSC